jgi:integrase
VENELVPPMNHHALQAVAGLKQGRCDAPESEPVMPVHDDAVEAILPHVAPQVRAMIEIQLLTGMRPGEVCAMRTCDIDTTGRLWVYQPASHKTQHHGHQRAIYIGPKAQEVLRAFLRPDLAAHLFSAKEAEEWRRTRQHAARKTPLSCGNKPGSNRKRKPGRKAGDRYSVSAYRRAIAYACEKVFKMPAEYKPTQRDTPEQKREKAQQRSLWHHAHSWHPHQLRHNAATRLRKEYGLEAAQVILGHKTLSVTQIYAEKNVAAAQRIMAEVG